MLPRLHSIALPITLLSASTLIGAQEPAPRTLPAMKVLPVGSSLHNLKIPRFNKQYETTSVLHAKRIDILAEHKMKGSSVDITLFKENSPQATTHLKTAFYNDLNGIIHSVENITISGDAFDIAAQGLILKWKNRTGFLLGKTETLFYSDIDKKMTSTVSTPQNKKSLAARPLSQKTKAMAVAATTIPALLSAEELKEIDTLAQPSTQAIATVDQQAQKEINELDSLANEVSETKQSLHTQLVGAIAENTTPTLDAVPIKQKDAKAVPVSVNCDNGMYFDAITGTVVYQSNVVVTHPQYHLTCDDELKVLLKADPKVPEAKEAQVTPGETVTPQTSNLSRFTGLDKAIATGNVVIKAKDSEGKLIITHSEIATYDGDTGVMILRGGRPTVQQGNTIARVLSDTGYIKILPNMSVRIEGRHEIKANLNELQNK
ncbi:hypothetical protein [Rubritalea tangerina]|uniref:Organic solvent tolerance-like N-terminal domain-containing protein n=1 Tax=Rubritalea tangerina TaxID=430798 RepID=A0ABW4Z671_9BACT